MKMIHPKNMDIQPKDGSFSFFILFLFNIWKYLNTSGAEIPILSLIFNMLVYLGIIMFIIHKNEIAFDYY